MSLAPGSRLGPYQVTALIGQGGMGQVWRATDTNLGRQVAVKVLPDAFAKDSDRLARFEREAKTLAALNHPNIASIYGLEKADGIRALVMELVEGPTLADRIAKGPIPVDEVLPIATQIAQALEAAHEQAIVHRDLKPANVKVRDDGTVKVLDFGLAKALDPVGASATAGDIADSPTITSPAMTEQGVILGTAAYMSPEQARGKPVDKRTDIWAFGCVLYEMLTGHRAFQGDHVSDTLAAILRGEPDWSALPRHMPSHLGRLLRRCLGKDPRRRLRDIGDVQLELDNVAGGADAPAAPPTTPWRRYERAIWLVMLGLVGAAVWFARTPAPPTETRLEVVAPQSTDTTFALSPDGRRIVYVAPNGGQNMLWLRELELDATAARPLGGTEAASNPFWSPDSRSVGFVAVSTGTGTLKRVDLVTGAVQTIADASVLAGAWAPSNVILYRPPGSRVLARISASGSEPPVAVTKLAGGATEHSDPQFLPDGRRFLFYCTGTEDVRGVYLSSLDEAEATRLTDAADALGRYVSPGWLAYLRQGGLVARRLDVKNRSLVGDAVLIAERVMWRAELAGRAGFSVSAQGAIAYRNGSSPSRQLTWFDRNGKKVGTLGQADEMIGSPELSPDGTRVVVHRSSTTSSGLGPGQMVGSFAVVDVWLIDAVREKKLTFGSSNYPIWSPDGKRIGFLAAPNGKRGEYVMSADGAGGQEILAEQPPTGATFNALTSWSSDGRFLLFDVNTSNPDVWVLPLGGDLKPYPFLYGSHVERLAHFSPNGQWVAYQSHDSGRAEIYIQPFPGPGGREKVSTSGGAQPRWSADGKELYWISPDAKLMAASISVKGHSIEAGTPVELFQTKIYFGGSDQPQRGQYNVAPDGRFLINTEIDDQAVLPITILQNWQPK